MNIEFNSPMFYNIGIVAMAEFIVLCFEQRPVEKMNSIIDFIESIFK